MKKVFLCVLLSLMVFHSFAKIKLGTTIGGGPLIPTGKDVILQNELAIALSNNIFVLDDPKNLTATFEGNCFSINIILGYDFTSLFGFECNVNTLLNKAYSIELLNKEDNNTYKISKDYNSMDFSFLFKYTPFRFSIGYLSLGIGPNFSISTGNTEITYGTNSYSTHTLQNLINFGFLTNLEFGIPLTPSLAIITTINYLYDFTTMFDPEQTSNFYAQITGNRTYLTFNVGLIFFL